MRSVRVYTIYNTCMHGLKVSDHGHINIYNEQGFSEEIKIILWYLKLKAFNYKASNNVQRITKASVDLDRVLR
jgi:hypothetical protein